MRAIIFLGISAAAFAQISVQTVDERKFVFDEISYAADKGTFEFSGKDATKKSIKADEVIEVVFPQKAAPPSEGMQFVLHNGDVIYGSITGSGEEDIDLKADLFEGIKVKYEDIDIVYYRRESTRPRDIPRDTDYIRFVNNDFDHGTIMKITAKETVLNSKLFGAERTYQNEKIRFVTFQKFKQTPKVQKGFICQFVFSRGSIITGALKEIANGEIKFERETGGPITCKLATLASIYPKSGKLVYLSDLEPSEVTKYPPMISSPDEKPVHDRDAIVKDLCFHSNPIIYQGVSYRKGIGVWAKTELSYDLAGQFTRFSAMFALDSCFADKPFIEKVNVKVKLFVDGKEVAAKVVGFSKTPEVLLTADVSGAKKLTILIDYGTYDNILAATNIILPRLYK